MSPKLTNPTLLGGSFTENFYGLKRLGQKEDILSKKDHLKSLLSLVGYPYLRIKFDSLFDSLISNNRESARDTFTSKVESFFIKLYPVSKSMTEGLFLFYQFLYLFERTDHFNPFLSFARLKIVRLTSANVKDQLMRSSLKHATALSHLRSMNLKGILSFMLYLWDSTFGSIKYIIPFAIFCYKFYGWWEENGKIRDGAPLPPVPDKISV